jgi:predicted glutamine amidotransferase
MKELVYNPSHSLIEQSRAARFTTHLTNADGFGVGWYGLSELPGVYRSVAPAWSDRNLQELCAQIASPLFLAHVRAATGTPAQQTNCHPFRDGRWLVVHNGFVDNYPRLRRDLRWRWSLASSSASRGPPTQSCCSSWRSPSDSTEDPLPALERMAGYVDTIGHRHGVAEPLQMTAGVSDGERLYAVRYASGQAEANSPLYVSNDARDVRQLYPEDERLQHLSDEARAVVSEPLADLPGLWREVPPSSAEPADDQEVPCTSQAPD